MRHGHGAALLIGAAALLAAAAPAPDGPLRGRVAPPDGLVLATYAEAGATDARPHALTEAEWAAVDRALARLPTLHQAILQRHLARLSFVDVSDGAGSALTSKVDDQGQQFAITLKASLFGQPLSQFLTTKEQTLFAPDGSGTRVTLDAGDADAVTYILLHEATHIVDQVLGLTTAADSPFRAGVWEGPRLLALPWAASPAAHTAFRRAPKIPTGQAAAAYRALAKTPFVSFYATAAAGEDVAELFAWQQLDAAGVRLTVRVADSAGRTLFRHAPLRAPAVRRRFRLVRDVLARPAP